MELQLLLEAAVKPSLMDEGEVRIHPERAMG
jgi:hypothetical protein